MLAQSDVNTIVEEARKAARAAVQDYFQNKLQGKDNYPCGFSWVNVFRYNGEKIRKNSKIGQMLEKAGVTHESYEKSFRLSNPGQYTGQNVDAKMAGSEAFAKVLSNHGFSAYPADRLD